MRKYAILNAEDISTRMANESVDKSKDALRKTVRNVDKRIVRWDGDNVPYGCSDVATYTHAEILAIVNDESGDWWQELPTLEDLT
tara:strand:- start:2089 stop:2343 length:255 start_codon:yes stop_codon:yes gene_type:complete